MAQRRSDLSIRLLLLLAVLFTLPAPLSAQYSRFGKNKVQYDDFQWEILSGDHLDVYYYPEERELAMVALDYAEESWGLGEQKLS